MRQRGTQRGYRVSQKYGRRGEKQQSDVAHFKLQGDPHLEVLCAGIST